MYPYKDTKQISFYWRKEREARGLTPSRHGTGSPPDFSNVSGNVKGKTTKRLWQIFPADETAERENGGAREKGRVKKKRRLPADVTRRGALGEGCGGRGGGVLPSDVWSQSLLHGDWSVTVARHLVQLPAGKTGEHIWDAVSAAVWDKLFTQKSGNLTIVTPALSWSSTKACTAKMNLI